MVALRGRRTGSDFICGNAEALSVACLVPASVGVKNPAGAIRRGSFGKLNWIRPVRPGRSYRLFQRRVDRSEVGVQRGAEAVDRRDNGKRDAGRNQTIFNRGRPRLIRPELLKNIPQVRLRMRKNG